MPDEKRIQCNNLTSFKKITSNEVEENEDIGGVMWEKDADVPEPAGKSLFGSSTIKPNY